MTEIYQQSTTNPTSIEVGIEYYLPTDSLHWIPNGFKTVDFTVDQDDLDEDFFGTLEEVAYTWCKGSGVTFSQILMD